jgi:hypothetical protein
MANRSDVNSKFPRQLKRLLALTKFASDTEEREISDLFREAHAHSKVARVRRLAAREVVNPGDIAD